MAIMSKSVVRACAVASVAVLSAQPAAAVEGREQPVLAKDLEAWRAEALAEVPAVHKPWLWFGLSDQQEAENAERDQARAEIDRLHDAEVARRGVAAAAAVAGAAREVKVEAAEKIRGAFLAKRAAAPAVEVPQEQQEQEQDQETVAPAKPVLAWWFIPGLIGSVVLVVGAFLTVALCLRKPAVPTQTLPDAIKETLGLSKKPTVAALDSDSEDDSEAEESDVEAGEVDAMPTAMTLDA